MIPQETPNFDDDSIALSEILFRLCKTAAQVSRREDGVYVLSSQIFSQNGSGCSIEFKSLLDAAGQTPQARVAAHNAFGSVSVTAQQVRTLKYKGPDGDKQGLKIAHTPLDAEKLGGPNPYHGDIFPGPTPSANKALTRLIEIVVPVDQARAAVEYAKRTR